MGAHMQALFCESKPTAVIMEAGPSGQSIGLEIELDLFLRPLC